MSNWSPLHDYDRSRAVLMATWDYHHLEPVPATENSLRRMERMLTGPLCGWPEDRLVLIENEPHPGDLANRLITAFEDTDIALFYYVGHGQLDNDGNLCLGLRETSNEVVRRPYTSLMFPAVRDALLQSGASTKIVVLDCCYAGAANRPGSGLGLAAGSMLVNPTSELLDTAYGTGAYTMAATSPGGRAWYESDADVPFPQTYFTKYLVDLVEEGIPGEPATLKVHPLFSALRERLAADERPVPESRAVNGARDFVFARNAAPPETQVDLALDLQRNRQELADLQARMDETSAKLAEADLERQQMQQTIREYQIMADRQRELQGEARELEARELEENLGIDQPPYEDDSEADPEADGVLVGRDQPEYVQSSSGPSSEPRQSATGPATTAAAPRDDGDTGNLLPFSVTPEPNAEGSPSNGHADHVGSDAIPTPARSRLWPRWRSSHAMGAKLLARLVLAVSGAAVLAVVTLVWLHEASAHGLQSAKPVSRSLPVQNYRDGLVVHTKWVLGGKKGSSLTCEITAIDSARTALAVKLEEPVPASIMTRLATASFTPSSPMVVDHGQGLVWPLQVPSQGQRTVSYQVAIPAGVISRARLERLTDRFSPVRPGPVPTPAGKVVLQSLAIMPRNVHLTPGRSGRLTLAGLLSSGEHASKSDLSQTVWSSANPHVATVNAFGKVTAVAAGKTEITAKVGKVTTHITVTVNPAPNPPTDTGASPYTPPYTPPYTSPASGSSTSPHSGPTTLTPTPVG
jgi:Bacterial Ig-like domain (group 2)/Caspase domain